jgi:hypothetical protein
MDLNDRYGYILRVKHEDWAQQVFELNKYYSGIIRRWKKGSPILLAMKTEKGDSFVGYGITDKTEMLWEMTPEEEQYCKENNWRCAITFHPLIRFENPLPIKETFLANDDRKGRYLHGASLNETQVEILIEQAKES